VENTASRSSRTRSVHQLRRGSWRPPHYSGPTHLSPFLSRRQEGLYRCCAAVGFPFNDVRGRFHRLRGGGGKNDTEEAERVANQRRCSEAGRICYRAPTQAPRRREQRHGANNRVGPHRNTRA